MNTTNESISIDQLYSEMRPALMKHCYFKGLSREESDDVIQNTVMTLIEILPKFEGKSKLSTFFYGIFLNKLREFYRSNSKQRNIKEKIKENTGEEIFDLPIENRDPLQTGLQKEAMEKLNASVEALKERSREIFIKKFFFGYDNQELAREYKLKENNVRQIAARARTKVETSYSKYMDVAV